MQERRHESFRRPEVALATPSGTDCWSGSDPAGRAAWGCPCRSFPMPHRATQRDGSLPATARSPGAASPLWRPWRNRKRAGDLHGPGRVRSDGDCVSGHRRCLADTRRSASAPAPGARIRALEVAARTPIRVGVHCVPGTHGSERLPHLDETTEAGVEAARFLDRGCVHAPDGVRHPLDPTPNGCDALLDLVRVPPCPDGAVWRILGGRGAVADI